MYTEHIPQIHSITDYHLRGIAACWPLATSQRILKWFVVQKLIFNPALSLNVYDDLIASKLVFRELIQQQCQCSKVEVYRLTVQGYEVLSQILSAQIM